MEIIDYAKSEIALLPEEDRILYGEMVLEFVKLYESQKHTFCSWMKVRDMFLRLVVLMPLTPLTVDDKWEKIGVKYEFNTRYNMVFRDIKTGQCYDQAAVIYIDTDGLPYLNRNSEKPIESFPYYPNPEYKKLGE